MSLADPGLTIRPATAAEIPEIVALEAEGFARPWKAAMYAEEIAREAAWVDLAVADGEIVGFVCAWLIAGSCHLLRIATRGDRRGAGIGRALVESLVERARAAGCDQIELEVASQNQPALRLYERSGFALVGRRPGYYRDPVDDALLLTLVL